MAVPTVRFDRGKGFAALAPYFPGYEPPAEAETVKQKKAA